MKNQKRIKRINYLKNILIPCLFLSGVAGVLTGALIFLFKVAANFVVKASGNIYTAVGKSPQYIPLLLLGAAALGLLAYLILRFSPESKGGGIPTAVAALRGYVSFSWIKNTFCLFFSAMVTFFAGVPLGNEGPSVQMGCAVGKGTVNIFAHKNKAWERYIMTGGACGGFAAATGAPLSGILFAFEEAHRRFSPIIFMAVSTATLASSLTMEALCHAFGKHNGLFELSAQPILPIKFIWSALVVGALCGVISILFTKAYRSVNTLINKTLEKVPFIVKIVSVFVITAALALLSSNFIGSGHSLIEEILYGENSVWYLLAIYFIIRAAMLLVANNVGVTGGIFVPSLAFGAMIGSLCAKAMISLGLISNVYSPLLICIGMASFLAASSRIPLTAIAFSLEALAGMGNIIPIAAAVAISYFIIETVGTISFTDTVIESKTRVANKGKISQTIDFHMVVQNQSFAVGKEIRDILWPPNCVVLSLKKSSLNGVGINCGDILHLRCTTYDPKETIFLLEALVGVQKGESDIRSTHKNEENYSVPEN